MPSIPQSLLWISLVVLWLFVLVPMLISKRESVRRTSDVALATRVLNSGRNAQRRRRGPAAGHNSDPHWRPAPDHLDADFEGELEETVPSRPPKRAVVVSAAATEPAEPDYLDVDIVEEDSGALPVGAIDAEVVQDVEEIASVDEDPRTDQLPLDLEATAEVDEVPQDITQDATEDATDDVTPDATEDVAEGASDEASEETQEPVDEDDTADDQSDLAAHEYEYVADSSGLEPEADTETAEDEAPAAAMSSSRQRRMESKTAARVSERKYRFRKRVLALFALILVASAAAAFLVTPGAWWVCGATATLTVLYLAYLRRQTRIEEQLRRRRAQRLRRSRLGVENTDDRKLDVVPARLRRPGAVVLDIDDEDPIFEHLEYTTFAREYDLPRASGQ
ncbi:divisome protein SepX/GlpR [Mycolicibacterium goodii]|uniref:Transmembrane protein n=1 Tax=Mycolicibacterium goodii TaxID=134601 RepID=A0ABS6HX86_MYCGD|nr:gephyrin-like molybdotransferase receptor GlpR [Mycolicibacterium goodii]MBU8827271.1 hypothetical protein [Mycolicibacterium goodii]MBU8835384.1 hypothetical protein [Mycolicibacterium goodii]OKH74524.1 membrane protein [Mycobacterium sp. SWH-M5]